MTVSVSDGSAIQWRYKSSDTSGDWTGLSYVTASDMNSATVDCPQPETVSSSQALGSCSGSGTATSTLTVNNTSGSTVYVKIEYSTDGGSNWSVENSNATIANGNGSLFTENVSHGSAITWRVTASDTSDDYTGLTPTTLSASSTVNCPSAVSLTASQSLGSCSAGSATSTLSLQNSSGSTAYVTAEYSLNGGSSWTVHTDAQEADNLTITNGSTNTSLTVSVSDGSAIQWRYKSSDTSGDWSGLSYITASDMNSSTVLSQRLHILRYYPYFRKFHQLHKPLQFEMTSYVLGSRWAFCYQHLKFLQNLRQK